jgi:hypothetical protein
VKEKDLIYQHEELPEGPWSTYVLKIARTNSSFAFTTTLGNGDEFGMAVVSDQVRALDSRRGEPVAAINGDFYDFDRDRTGIPRDLQIRGGEMVTGPAGHDCFWLDSAGQPHSTNLQSRFQIRFPDGTALPFRLNNRRARSSAVVFTRTIGDSTGTYSALEAVLERAEPGKDPWLPLQPCRTYKCKIRQVNERGNSRMTADTMVLSFNSRIARSAPQLAAGMILEISTEIFPMLDNVKIAVGGGPTLVRAGKAMQWNGYQRRHPRTAIGWNRDFYYFVEVDGRQLESVGMTFPEIANYMKKLGCDEAMNLDGGGSSTFWIFGNVMNHPSEGWERPSPNAIVLVKTNDISNAGENGQTGAAGQSGPSNNSGSRGK